MSLTSQEDQALKAMLSLLESMKSFEVMTTTDSKAWEVSPGSSLAIDDAKINPYHLSHLAWQALGVGVDHLQCLRSTLIGDQHDVSNHTSVTVVLHIYAQATLLRAAFENACRAVWLLAPTNRLVRLQRRLSLQNDSNRHSDRMHQLVGATPPRTSEARKKEITDLAVAAGTAPSDAKKALTFVGFQKVVQDAGPRLGVEADQAEAIWSMCSALAHGDVHNLSFLDRQVVGTQGNVNLAKLTSNTDVLLRATELSVRMLRHGFALYEKAAAAT
ncbi:hypothetical protein [Streptomyces scabiei]|uniref:hypothetical protein n=1 Tax=Streptomyces scabiei TaxID=1930 RepID=UPI0029B8E1B7|nr:hypothetical protein [Streptomyces scabiei]MDX3209114.1 hypothetical protein [Streptomyces scabiei]